MNTLFDGDPLRRNVIGQQRAACCHDSFRGRQHADQHSGRSCAKSPGEKRRTAAYFGRYADRLQLAISVKVVGQLGTQLKPPQLRELVDQFQSQDFPAEESILTAGEVPEHFYLIQSGRVNVVKEGEVQTTLTSGDTFGGSALVERPPVGSYFTFQSDGPVSMLTLAAADFCRLLDDVPQVRTYFEERAVPPALAADDAAEHFDTVTRSGREMRQSPRKTLPLPAVAEPERTSSNQPPRPQRWSRSQRRNAADEEVGPAGENADSASNRTRRIMAAVPVSVYPPARGSRLRSRFAGDDHSASRTSCGRQPLARLGRREHHGGIVDAIDPCRPRSRLRNPKFKLTADRLPKLQLPAVHLAGLSPMSSCTH